MITLGKIREKFKAVNVKKTMIGMFAIGVLTGVGLPYFGGTGASAVNAATGIATNAVPAATGAAVTYSYIRIPMSEAYPLYIAAAFTVAGGLLIYALSYVPVRQKSRSRYASRTATWAKTTY